MSKDSGIVNIHGKEYQTVAYRVGKFREIHGFDLLLTTEIIARDEDYVVMKATITNLEGKVVATGHSEERRNSSQINRTSALENAETSAIGRALAALGLGGTEFATADEVANAISQQKKDHSARAACVEAGNELDPNQKKMVELTRDKVIEALNADRDFDAYGLCESLTDDMIAEKLYLWSLLDSKQRRRLKKQADKAKQPKAA